MLCFSPFVNKRIRLCFISTQTGRLWGHLVYLRDWSTSGQKQVKKAIRKEKIFNRQQNLIRKFSKIQKNSEKSKIAKIHKSKKAKIQKNHSTNADFNFIEEAIEKFIKNKKIVNKPTIQGMTSYFPISNDQLNENKVTESEPITPDISTSPPSNISFHETSSNCQPLFRYAMILSKMRFSIRFMKIMSNLNIM